MVELGQLPGVNLHVPLQVVAVDELLITHTTVIGLLPRMDPLVHAQAGRVGEAPSTVGQA